MWQQQQQQNNSWQQQSPQQPQQSWGQQQQPPPQQQQSSWQQPPQHQPQYPQPQQHQQQQQQGGWGGPQQQQQQQQWNQQQQWGQQPGMCSCCDQCCQQPGQCCQCQQGQCCQCQQYGQPVDPYCCGPPAPEQQEMAFCCDLTCWTVGLFFILSVIGFAVVLGTKSPDNIFDKFSVSTTRQLDAAIVPLIPYRTSLAALCIANATTNTTPAPTATNTTLAPVNTTTVAPATTTTVAPTTASPSASVSGCTQKHIFGTFGTVCMEDTLYAGTMVANLSHWNNFRGTLYFLAFIITFFFMLVVYAVHRQKHPQGGFMNSSQVGQQLGVSPNINLFGTELYEVFRCVWFVSGLIVFFWVANAMTSYWNFIGFWKNNTEGALHDFWVAYDKKFVASVVCVTIYLAWPIFLIGLEIAIWIVFVIPYMAVRCMLKPGIENVRPDVPAADMPGWVRTDMFFTEIQQIRRLGFSTRLWEMVTGSKEAFCPTMDCCQMQGFGGPQGGPPQQQWGQQQPPAVAPSSPHRPVQPPRPGQMGDSEMNRSTHAQPPTQQMPPPPPAPQHHHHHTPQMASSGNFYPQPQESMPVSSTVEVDGERKEKKEKKHKKDKSDSEKKDKGTKEKKDKTGTKEKKEKKHKKDKHESED
ncbi:transmembrane protein, putative [Bodo saltans]|uniref:Transmembrane protein, putative n=1 Tax=Bodo saltans TaxID=75058 RepID=A0A0S4IMZ2_BODSA|nr:transmembrane protein, putative [Bodo saltans]|eukprot:CUE69611.1 transmembrane protein, putative [Bodo saltans]